MSGSGEAVGGGGALAATTGTADGGSEVMGRPLQTIAEEYASMRSEATGVAEGDYTTMSGADFRRVVGADPEKWAAAFVQCCRKACESRDYPPTDEYVAGWFRD